MGFYRGRREDRFHSSNSWRWVAVVALSALVGSGATLAIESTSNHRGITLAKSISASSRHDDFATVTNNVNVNVTDGVTEAVKRVEPAVVGVENYARVSDFFSQQSKLEATGVGTGVMFYKDGKYCYLVTNNHVVAGAAKVDIVLNSSKHINATVVGTDPYTDLAVIKVPLNAFKGIEPVTFANSDNIQPGEPAIAIGTPMGLDFADTVTSGIVSAKQRLMPVQDPGGQSGDQTLDYQTVIQTDAAINPGNSGGPLVNINGSVIGINSSKIVAQNFEGMGFAIPSNEVQIIAKQLMSTGHAEHPALGVTAYSLGTLPQQMWPDVPVDYGVWIRAVTSKESRASGLQANDVIVGLNGHTVKTTADLRTYLFKTKPGDTATLKVYRGNKLLTLKVKIGSMETELTTDNRQQSDDDD
ncbi:S1C family serine protease [Alicyclobacillus fodiniaquatilis]|uniref:S1C family serine protease n=1 Tax=Alicyclobacillus fodiniaquatilis TaxID=1661150 RepID=A0ABW4JJH1_9BACL